MYRLKELFKWFWGDLDAMLISLITFIVVELLIIMLLSIFERLFSRRIGLHALIKQTVLLLLVGIGNIIDIYLVGEGKAFRTAIICYYIAYEGISILENAAKLGLPLPKKLKIYFRDLQNRTDDDQGIGKE